MRFRDSRKGPEDLVKWILDKAVDGIGPLLPSASDLADEYRCKTYANDAERVQALIWWAVAKNAATGFVSSLGGVLTLPVTIPGSLAASLAIQVPMVGAIAEIYGHDSKDDQVQTAMLLCDLTGVFCTSGSERESHEGGSWTCRSESTKQSRL